MKLIMSVRWVVLIIFIYFPLLVSASKPTTPPVAIYPIDCGEHFSCPKSILPRVGFWVEVFSRWDTNTAIFHDKNNPHWVYSTVQRKQGCRRSRKGDAIYKERKKLQRQLEVMAHKVAKKKSLDEREQQWLSMFGTKSNKASILKAAKNIRCQSGNRDRMQEALRNFQKYRPMILNALEEQKISTELQYLPFVESAFNPNALSHVGAAGLWQIMPQTGRVLGLQVNNRVDERYDPMRASHAAAKYFRNSVDRLSEVATQEGYSITAKKLTPFVITSYNYGVKGMQRGIKKVGLNYEDLLQKYKSPNFQIAVKNFYSSFLAARFVAKNTSRFFGEIDLSAPPISTNYVTINLARATSVNRIVQTLGVNRETLKQLNPAVRKVVWNNKSLLPKNFALRLPNNEKGWSNLLQQMNTLPKEYEKPGYFYHKVRRGETACKIAQKYRVSCRAFKKLNRLNRRATIYAGRKVKIPAKNGGISVFGEGGKAAKHRVQAGETACSIAKLYAMSCNKFLAINGLSRSTTIKTGQWLYIDADSKAKYYIVRSGDTMCGIAKKFKVNCNALLKLNKLKRNGKIYVGMRLRLP